MITPERLRNVSRTRIRIGGGVVLGLLVAGSVGFAADSYVTRRGEVREDRVLTMEAEAELERLSAQRRDVLVRISSHSGVPELPEGTLEPESENELAAALGELAEIHGVLVQGIREVPKSGEGEGMAFRGAFTGTYQGIDGFLRLVHERVPSVHVRGLAIEVESESEQLLSAQATLEWFVGSPEG